MFLIFSEYPGYSVCPKCVRLTVHVSFLTFSENPGRSVYAVYVQKKAFFVLILLRDFICVLPAGSRGG
jgi:hypothetical protein